MQVDPIKPTLKAPGIDRLKLNYDKLLSNFAFKFNLRCYTEAEPDAFPEAGGPAPRREARRIIGAGLVTHCGVQCDVCNALPIRGTRYKSVSSADYDLCERCHASGAGAYTRPLFIST